MGLPGWLPGASLVFLALAAYVNSLGGGFITDDQFQILNNPVVTGARPLFSAFTSGVWTFLGYHGNYFRPLQFLVYGLIYRAFGPHPLPFHMLMWALHAVNTALVFAVARRLLGGIAAPWIAAAIFAVNPIHTEAVNWIAALPDVLTATLILAGLWLLLARDSWIAAHCGLYLAALLTKETGIVLPALYALALGLAKRPLRPRRGLFVALAGVLAFYLALRVHALGGLAPAQQAFFHLTPVEFALSAVALLAHYFWALAWPFDLNFFHVFHPTNGITPALLASAVMLAALLWLAVRYRKRQPVALFCLAWIVASLVPALNIAGVGQNVFTERYLYLPSVGLAIACGLAAAVMPMRAAAPVAAVVLVAFAARTITRNPDWRDDFTLLQTTERQSPDSGYIHNLMAGAWVQRDQFQRGLEEQRLAVQDEPRSSVYHKNLGNILLVFDPAAAVREFQIAIALGPDTQELHDDLALAQRAAAKLTPSPAPPAMPPPAGPPHR